MSLFLFVPFLMILKIQFLLYLMEVQKKLYGAVEFFTCLMGIMIFWQSSGHLSVHRKPLVRSSPTKVKLAG